MALSWLENAGAKLPNEQQKQYQDLCVCFQKKLWFQLSTKLTSLLSDPFFQQGSLLSDLYDNFVHAVREHLRPLDFAQLAIAASRSIKGTEALSFMQAVEEEFEKQPEARVFCRLERALVLLNLNKLASSGEEIEAADKALHAFPGIMDKLVYSHFHRASLRFHKAKGNSNEFFQHCLSFLAYTPLETLNERERQDLAVELAVAALLGEKVFNFGELVEHPLILSLKDTPAHTWLVDMLTVCNNGDIDAFNTLFAKHRAQQPLLGANEAFLCQKVRIFALMQLAFERVAQRRSFKFAELATACQVSEEEVELLVMKAFALHVLSGAIDQVDQVVHVKWVQPRVLSGKQIGALKNRLEAWSARVVETTAFFENEMGLL